MRIKKFVNLCLTVLWASLFIHYTWIMHTWGPAWITCEPEYYVIESWGLGCFAALTWVINKFLEE